MSRAKSKTTAVTKPKSLAATKSRTKPADKSSANIGFEAKLWLTADKLRNNMDAAEYKHVVLGLIFLNYISEAFEERHHKQVGDIAVYGQASDATTRRLAMKIAPSEVVTICDHKAALLTRRIP